MQSESAVVSITRRPRSIASRCVSAGRNVAFGSVRRVAVVDALDRRSSPIRIASAPISSARSAAAVSVVKNGLPVPAAKMTTRPFSRCRIARRRMYGSATSETSSAERTRVSAPAPLERVLERERVQDRREHAGVVRGRAVHPLGRGGHAAVDVAAADDDRELEPLATGRRRSRARSRRPSFGSMPYSWSPISASPESFRRTRRNAGAVPAGARSASLLVRGHAPILRQRSA